MPKAIKRFLHSMKRQPVLSATEVLSQKKRAPQTAPVFLVPQLGQAYSTAFSPSQNVARGEVLFWHSSRKRCWSSADIA
jgi:phosphoribosyl-AMP cyclohydrolase